MGRDSALPAEKNQLKRNGLIPFVFFFKKKRQRELSYFFLAYYLNRIPEEPLEGRAKLKKKGLRPP